MEHGCSREITLVVGVHMLCFPSYELKPAAAAHAVPPCVRSALENDQSTHHDQRYALGASASKVQPTCQVPTSMAASAKRKSFLQTNHLHHTCVHLHGQRHKMVALSAAVKGFLYISWIRSPLKQRKNKEILTIWSKGLSSFKSYLILIESPS